MAIFQLTMQDAKGGETPLFYDNLLNQFSDDEGKPLVSHALREDEEEPYVIRVFAGKSCNFRCKYCLQRDERCSPQNKMDRRELVREILRVVGDKPLYRTHIWGGEPFLHFDAMREFAALFKELDPSREHKFATSTNGSFLGRADVREWCVENVHQLQISWDGPGQHLRGPDPLADKKVLETIAAMQEKRQGSIVFNPVVSKENRCLVTYRDAIQERIGTEDFRIGPARLLLPFDDASARYAITDEQELQDYSRSLQKILLENLVPQWDFALYSTQLAYSTIGTPVKPIYCPGERKRFLIIDEAGSILTCANTASDSVDEYGDPFGFGHITRIPQGGGRDIPPFKRLQERRAASCADCFVYSVCMGGCPRIPANQEQAYCRARFAESLPIYTHMLFLLTGKIVTQIDCGEVRHA